MYYTINEDAARRAKEANSFDDYKAGTATAQYHTAVDKAAAIAAAQKSKVDPMYHEKIDGLLDRYARKLADNLNARNAIDARVPSMLITGGGNFPTAKKEKQNAARDKNMGEYMEIKGLLDKMRSVGRGGIQSGDPQAVEKLEKKLESLRELQETMKAVNAYYRKNKTLDDCPGLSVDQIERMKVAMARDWRADPKPFESYALTNNNANIHRIEERLEHLRKVKQAEPKEVEAAGGVRLVENTEAMRVQLFFPDKPDEETRSILKSNGFRWAPSCGAWQRQLTQNGVYAARKVLEVI